ncbi:hypothetical protein [Cupriavidus necator]
MIAHQAAQAIAYEVLNDGAISALVHHACAPRRLASVHKRALWRSRHGVRCADLVESMVKAVAIIGPIIWSAST